MTPTVKVPSTLGADPSGWGPNIFPSVCPGLALHPDLSPLSSSQTTVMLSSRINTDTQRTWDMWSTCPKLPPLLFHKHIHTILTPFQLIFFHHFYSVSSSATLSCRALSFPVMFLSILHVWAMVPAPCAGGQPNSFLLYLCPNPITQLAQDCPPVNGNWILREMVVGNNKPAMKPSQDGFRGMTAKKHMTCCIFWLHYCTPKVLDLIVVALIDYFTITETGSFQSELKISQTAFLRLKQADSTKCINYD